MLLWAARAVGAVLGMILSAILAATPTAPAATPLPTPLIVVDPGPTEEVVPIPVATPEPTPAPTPRPTTARTYYGIASWMPEKYGARYLALPEGPGHRVRICAARCIVLTSMDTGPVRRIYPDRVADLSVVLWERVCNLPRSHGLCRVSITVLRKS